MRKMLFAAAMVGVLAFCALAQPAPEARTISLDLEMIGRNAGSGGALPWGPAQRAADGPVVVNNAAGPAVARLEVRYRINDADPNDNYVPTGLADTKWDVRTTFAPSTGASLSFARFLVEDNRIVAPPRDAVVNTGTLTTPPAIGLPNPFRGGIFDKGTLGVYDGNVGINSIRASNTVEDPDFAVNTQYFLYAFQLNIPESVPAGDYTVRFQKTFGFNTYLLDNLEGPVVNIPTFATVNYLNPSVTIRVVPSLGAGSSLGLSLGLFACLRRRRA